MREWFFRKALRILEKHTPGIVVRAELQILLNTTAHGFGVPGRQIWQYPAARALEEYAGFTAACLHDGKRESESPGDGSACLHDGKGESESPGDGSACLHDGKRDAESLSDGSACLLDGKGDSESTGAVPVRQCSRKCDPGSAGNLSRSLFRAAYMTGRRVRRLTGFTQSEDISHLTFWLYRNLCITMTGKIPGKIMVKNCYFSRYYTPEDCRIMSRVDSGIISGLCGGGRLTFTNRITEGCNRCTACFTQPAERAIRQRQTAKRIAGCR